jgi:hypothetical protein
MDSNMNMGVNGEGAPTFDPQAEAASRNKNVS